MELGFWSGWITTACVLVAGGVPVIYRLRHARRPTPDSSTTGIHVALGGSVAGLAFAHALLSVFSLGSSSAIESGDLALAFGGAALFVLVAHAGIGLQLRNPKLRDRTRKRRIHALTASTVLALVAAHAILLLRAG